MPSSFSYALSCLHVASSHNCTKLNMCIWWWYVATDHPWLSNSTLTVVLILLHSMTEHVLGPYWWGCIASAFSRSWGSMTQSLYLILRIMESNECVFWCVCVCVWRTGQSFTQNTWRNRDYLEELDIAESVILKWILKMSGGKVCWIGLICSGQWLVWELYEQSNECRKFLE